MPYIEFGTDVEGLTILVEVDEDAIEVPAGLEKAGIFGRKGGAEHSIAVARKSFGDALGDIVREQVRAVAAALDGLQTSMDEVEISFGMKATGEFGNLAIAKIGGEATFEVRLVWKPAQGAH